MNRILKVGDRVRNIRVDAYKDEPIVIIDIVDHLNRYHIKYLNFFTVSGTNMVSWVDGADLTLDIEYYRNLKIENIIMIKILVIGEKCIDRFMYCDVSRFSPEAPVPVLNPIEIVENDGMAGNVVRNILAMKNDSLVSHWYQDEIITKTRFVEKKSNHMFLRLDEGETNISKIELTEERLNDISNFDIVIVSDYDKGFMTNNDLLKIGMNSKISILDSKRKLTKEIVSSYTFVKLNEKESLQNSELLECNNILVTLGSRGTKFNDELYPSPNPQETIDVSGAGDTFTSSFILKYLETGDIKTSIIYANEMASIVVSKRGVATP